MAAFRRDARFQHLIRRFRFLDYWRTYGPPDGCALRDGEILVVDR